MLFRSLAQQGELAADVMLQLVLRRQAWVNDNPFAPLLTEPELIEANRSMEPATYRFLKAWIAHGDDHQAISQETGLSPTTLSKHRTRIRNAFNVNSLMELDLRVPGGLSALVEYLDRHRS